MSSWSREEHLESISWLELLQKQVLFSQGQMLEGLRSWPVWSPLLTGITHSKDTQTSSRRITTCYWLHFHYEYQGMNVMTQPEPRARKIKLLCGKSMIATILWHHNESGKHYHLKFIFVFSLKSRLQDVTGHPGSLLLCEVTFGPFFWSTC